MRATGIVRRIDELGRVVIPKEIRRTLRIREGDPLEIFTDHDGEVVLKKYSPIGEIATIAKDYTDSLHRTLGHVCCICDRDIVVSASGSPKRDLWEKTLSSDMENAIQARQAVHNERGDGAQMMPITADDVAAEYISQVIIPILSDGEVIGALLLLNKDNHVRMSDSDVKVAETTATIIGRQMEQ
jgi:AbrB family transcriptional regulator (stage V sporulation protein T)